MQLKQQGESESHSSPSSTIRLPHVVIDCPEDDDEEEEDEDKDEDEIGDGDGDGEDEEDEEEEGEDSETEAEAEAEAEAKAEDKDDPSWVVVVESYPIEHKQLWNIHSVITSVAHFIATQEK